jgi:hypothetical protein
MDKTEIEILREELLAEKDLEIPVDKIIEQIKILKIGIPFLKLVSSCTLGNGIKKISEVVHEHYIKIYLSALDESKVIKFVPASGAATRMFKKQLSVLAEHENVDYKKIKELADKGDENCKSTLNFIDNIHHFAFYHELKKIVENKGKNFEDLIQQKNVSEIVISVTDEVGLNYANLPKGAILFHSYPNESRTAFEEHLIEGMNYSVGNDKVVRIHFTISPEHDTEIKALFASLIEKYNLFGWKFDLQFSFQSHSTNTISVTVDNKLFRDENGNIIFRPGGHGALIKNLNDLNADIISIKNIDNVAPDHLKEESYKYKKILGGYLIELQDKVFKMLHNLEASEIGKKFISEVIDFIFSEFDQDLSQILESKTIIEKKKYLFNYLNRPLRVCGMVIRENHPGGSPFWVEGANGEISKQIVETAQVNLNDKNQQKIFDEATHFNPVDLACSVRDFRGNSFDLEKFSNPQTGLITKKSKDGRELKALELPGLWNGGMYHWLTVFVEVPKITFNPVKEINDLLKPEHQPL